MKPIDKKSEMVILVHGYFYSKSDMFPLRSNLSRMGYKTLTPNLPTKFGSLEECYFSFEQQFRAIEMTKIHFVGHSMGGLIIRYFLSKHIVPNIGKCVLIGTPNQGSVLADILSRFVHKISKPLNCLKTSAKEIPPPLNKPCPEFGVIAGTHNKLLAGKLFLSKNSDGRVETESTKFDLMTDFIELPYDHKAIHHQKETAQLVSCFLQSGKFKE